jgi:hypothetical protein
MIKQFSSLLILISLASAQSFEEPANMNYENIMAQMQQMQTCMAKVDMASLAPIQQEALEIEKKLQLCVRIMNVIKLKNLPLSFLKKQ